MAQYFFQVDDASGNPEEDGQDFDDDEAASLSAVRAFGEMLKDERVLLVSGLFTLHVTDDDGRTVLRLRAEATR